MNREDQERRYDYYDFAETADENKAVQLGQRQKYGGAGRRIPAQDALSKTNSSALFAVQDYLLK